MSLVYSAMEASNIMDKTTTKDEYGSVATVWVEGAEIEIAYSIDSSTEARVAAQQGAKNRYTLFTRKAIVLRFNDVVKRARDGKTFRVTSDGDDMQTPETAALDLRAVEAEEWEIPKNG